MQPNAMIMIQAHAIVASSNFAKDEGMEKLKIDVTMVLFADSTDKLFTILGNILSGTIRTNVGPLSIPWGVLNSQNAPL